MPTKAIRGIGCLHKFEVIVPAATLAQSLVWLIFPVAGLETKPESHLKNLIFISVVWAGRLKNTFGIRQSFFRRPEI